MKAGEVAQKSIPCPGAKSSMAHRPDHKLIRWNLVIIGGIDGFSQLPLMLKCTDNNKAVSLG